MKITKTQLKQIIKEEIDSSIGEGILDMFKRGGAEEETAAFDSQVQQQVAEYDDLIQQIVQMAETKVETFKGFRDDPKYSPEALSSALRQAAEAIATSENKNELSRFKRYLDATLTLIAGDGSEYGSMGSWNNNARETVIPGPLKDELRRVKGFYKSIVDAVPAAAATLPEPDMFWHPQGHHRGLMYLPAIKG